MQIEGQLDPETVKTAYVNRVKEVRENGDFEALLLDLNVARDTLLAHESGSRELVPALAKELAAISARQNELVEINDAKDEIRDSFSAIERRSINRIKGTRDLTGLLSAASAALAFGKENLMDLLPSVADVALYSQTLMLLSAIFAFFAFMANRRSGEVSSRMDDINRNLTRDRQISRLLLQVFRDEESLGEIEFEDRLRDTINELAGVRGRPSGAALILEMYGAIGLPVPIRIYLGREFVDDYIDYLLKSGHLYATGVSGTNMVFHKVK
ncbi:hypothetical protein [Shimia ponticola]|uniref:hypothetical protein n=1 Tax=Shimia ponticola TaxID=2582893 RepID=UPI0011BD8790|nr:hypothetical protein [Shimia ponticola]